MACLGDSTVLLNTVVVAMGCLGDSTVLLNTVAGLEALQAGVSAGRCGCFCFTACQKIPARAPAREQQLAVLQLQRPKQTKLLCRDLSLTWTDSLCSKKSALL